MVAQRKKSVAVDKNKLMSKKQIKAQADHDIWNKPLLWLDTSLNSGEESNRNLVKDLVAEKTLLAD